MSRGLSRRRAGKAFLRKFGKMFVPVFISSATEFEKTIPTKNSGRVHIVEGKQSSKGYALITATAVLQNMWRTLDSRD